ncbi:MAG: tRNA 5-methoxyuridine(34)/uridine 5-oxyacetic acid(34) synthase CmoB, partial [Luminiphilus sp.]
MDNLIAAELQTLEQRWRDSGLQPWLEQLPQQMARGFSTTRYGDLPRWTEALSALPKITPEAVQLDAARVGC